jgi:translation initiation factor 2 subunit 1
VYAKDLLQCEDRFAKAKAVNSILRHVADQLHYDSNEQLEDLYERTAWFFDKQHGRKAASYDVFKKAITWVFFVCRWLFATFSFNSSEPSVLDVCDITPDVREKLLEDIRKRLTPTAVKIRAGMCVCRSSHLQTLHFADIEVSCFGYEGIDAVKAALREGLKCSTEEMPIKVHISVL